MKKKGFTLLELVVSIVLVSVVMISLIATLIQLRNTYNVVHENSDVLVFGSSATRIINNDIANNNGIRSVSCNEDNSACNLVMGNDTTRLIEITNVYEAINYTKGLPNKEYSRVKNTLRYIDTSKAGQEKLIYIKTLTYERVNDTQTGEVTTDSYHFLDIDTKQYEYDDGVASNPLMDSFTTLTIRVSDEKNYDDNRYNIVLYASGRYDYNNLIGKSYTIIMDPDGASIEGTVSIDEVFGVGFYKSETTHRTRMEKIEVPAKEGKAFLGYFYQISPTDPEYQVIDSSGNIVASPRLFKSNVALNDPSGKKVYAKWGDCTGGYEIVSGVCKPKKYTLTLNRDGGTVGTESVTVTYMSKIPSITPPGKAGKKFLGYYSTSNVQYYSYTGAPLVIYETIGSSTVTAHYDDCPAGTFNAGNQSACTLCTANSIAPTTGSSACTPCGNGMKTPTGDATADNRVSCTERCDRYDLTTAWVEPTWSNNYTSSICYASSCITGYSVYSGYSEKYCKANSYYIKYSLSGGTSGDNKPSSANYNSELNISNPTKENYVFLGWNLATKYISSSAQYYNSSTWSDITSGTQLITSEKFKNLTASSDGYIYLHANWRPVDTPESELVTCEPGYYIPAGSSTCETTCIANYYCLGGKYVPSSSSNVGITKCDNDKLSDEGTANPLGCYTPSSGCLAGDTEIEVYDKKKKKRLRKKLRDITYDDLILAWDFDKGEYVWVEPLWIMKPIPTKESVILTFSDGTTLKVVGDHRIYNCELNKFSLCKNEKETYIGMHTINSNGEKIELVNKEYLNEEIDAYNVITKGHINMFANGILTSQGSNNIYEIKDMKFVKSERDRFTKEELNDIPEEYIEGLRLTEWITDDKGSREETLKDMKDYVASLENKKRL